MKRATLAALPHQVQRGGVDALGRALDDPGHLLHVAVELRAERQRQHALQPGGGDIAEGWLLYPNPAADWVRLHHPSLAAGTHVRLELFDLEGQHKFTREATVPVDGPFEIPLQLRSLASGVYFCRIEVEGEAGSRHLLRRLGVLR